MLPEGWTTKTKYTWGGDVLGYTHTDGREQSEHPGKPEGAIALADAIKTNGALTSLNLSRNKLRAEGAKYVAEAIKVNVSAIRLVPF